MNKLIFAVTVLAVSVVATHSQADTPTKRRGLFVKPKTTYANKVEKPERKGVEYIEITREVPTGSNIPMVVRRYNDRSVSMSPLSNYSREDLEKTGALDVGGELFKRDPSITLRGVH